MHQMVSLHVIIFPRFSISGVANVSIAPGLHYKQFGILLAHIL